MHEELIQSAGACGTPWAQQVVGPIRLPLEVDSQVHYFHLNYYEVDGGRWVAATLGDLSGPSRAALRIESACFFGHVFGSRQCDCGFQLDEAFRRIARDGRGVVVYAVDQDARGLGLQSHFRVYDYRQNHGLDTEEVFERLHAGLDNRSYGPVGHILRHLGIGRINLLSNNPSRLKFLQDEGFDVQRELHEAPLDAFNMATLMLEKEDLGYQWTFKTHSEWLSPLQRVVDGQIDRRAASIVVDNSKAVVTWSGEDWNVAERLLEAAPAGLETPVVYLSDLPRLDELEAYATYGAKFVVVPFADLPADLTLHAAKLGVKLQDWGRENRYRSPRPQWLLGEDGVYRRGDEVRTVDPAR
jgi:GTP cyclohydrolase II